MDARGTARGAGQKFRQRAFRAAFRPGFQGLTTRHHQRNHGGGSGLIQRQRAQDGEKRNHIHAKPPTHQRTQHTKRHMQRNRDGGCRPGDGGVRSLAGKMQRDARGKPCQHPGQQQPRRVIHASVPIPRLDGHRLTAKGRSRSSPSAWPNRHG